MSEWQHEYAPSIKVYVPYTDDREVNRQVIHHVHPKKPGAAHCNHAYPVDTYRPPC